MWAFIDTSDRNASRDWMTLCGTGAYAVTRIGEHLLGDALSTSE